MKQIDDSIPSKVKNIVKNGVVNGFSNMSVGDMSLLDTKPDGIAEAKLVTGLQFLVNRLLYLTKYRTAKSSICLCILII